MNTKEFHQKWMISAEDKQKVCWHLQNWELSLSQQLSSLFFNFEEDFTQQLWAHSKIFLMNICEVVEDSMGFLVFA